MTRRKAASTASAVSTAAVVSTAEASRDGGGGLPSQPRGSGRGGAARPGGPYRARHLAARAQGVEGRPDRHLGAAAGGGATRPAAATGLGSARSRQGRIPPRRV